MLYVIAFPILIVESLPEYFLKYSNLELFLYLGKGHSCTDDRVVALKTMELVLNSCT